MGTTVWVDDEVREMLRAHQERLGMSSVSATIRQLLEHPPLTAQQIFARHRDDIAALMARHQVTELIAYGSRARGDMRPDSDLDLAARFAPGAPNLAPVSLALDLEGLLGIHIGMSELPQPLIEEALTKDGIRFVP